MLKLLQDMHGLFSKYLNEEFILKTKKSIYQLKEDIQDIIKSGNFGLVSANSSKKKLKTIGFDPRLLIVTGGPLFFEDYKKINQNISNNSIISIKKKCERILSQIENINWNHKDLIFIYDGNNTTDKLILKRIDDLSKLIGKKVKALEITSWNVLDKF